MGIPGYIRSAGRLLLPVNMPLPMRYWRWLWLAMALRLVIGVPLFIAAIVPYLLCKGVCSALDATGALMGDVPVRCYNRDLKNSAWHESSYRAPAPKLGPDWQP